MDIKQGDIFWIDLGISKGSEPGYGHLHTIIQKINQTKINTVVVCAITSNPKLANAPGNVLFKKGEGGLKKDSFVFIYIF